jgi:MFS family permease
MAQSALAEWRRYPLLPIAAALGYATSVLHVYGLGPYIEPISREFGWSRAQTTAGLTLATLLQCLGSIPVGMAVDRLGARPLGLVGALLLPAAFALLGTATGGKANWYLLWGLMALAALSVQPTIWSSALASRFFVSRGLALAVGLCGASGAAALFPWLGSKLISAYGWQRAVVLQAAIWAGVAFPLIALFFRGANDSPPGPGKESTAKQSDIAGANFLQGLRSSIYQRLLLASLLFSFTILALVVHFVPLLTGGGLTPVEAAGAAALIGLFSLAGRVGTGLLLDRLRGSWVGAGAFLLPAFGCLALIATDTSSRGALLAAMLIGLTLGAETDVIVYLATRHFGLHSFGALYGGLLIALSVGTAIGPLTAARVFDVYGSYTPFLWLSVACMVASSLTLASLPQPPPIPGQAHRRAHRSAKDMM